MRVKRLTTWLVLGIAVALAYTTRRRRSARRRPVPSVPAPGVRVRPAARVAPAAAARASVPWGEPVTETDADQSSRADVYGDRRARLGDGDLYGVHVVPAADLDVADDDEAQDVGESWLEQLNASSAELGPEPERPLDVIDDSDPHTGHHKTATTDTPVADHGSGGPRGL